MVVSIFLTENVTDESKGTGVKFCKYTRFLSVFNQPFPVTKFLVKLRDVSPALRELKEKDIFTIQMFFLLPEIKQLH